MHASTTAEPITVPAVSSARWRTHGLRLALLAVFGWLVWEIVQVSLLGNVHTVVPGKLYRGAQPTGADVEELVRRYGIRTIINARGCGYPEPWFIEQSATCQRLGVQLEDVTFSAMHLPSRDDLRELIEVLDRTDRPIFVHCRQGADRTGLTAVVALLLDENCSYETARQQLGLRFGHVPLGRTTNLDRFVDLYEAWLKSTEQVHHPRLLRHWILHEYRGGWCNAEFEKVERLFDAPRLGETLAYRVTVRNTSNTAWHFHTHKSAGVHVTLKLIDGKGKIHYEQRAGLFERIVPVGENIQVTIAVPPIWKAGSYRLYIDMIDEGHCWFHQTGSEPWEEELVVRE